MSVFKTNRILVPFDFSDACVEAVKVALELASDTRDVHVLHVLQDLSAADPYVIWNEDADAERRVKARESMEGKLTDVSIGDARLDVGLGDPGRTINSLAEEIEAGLIIIPSHGRKGLNRMFLGSVAERVVRHAHCPVLVLKE